MEITQYTYHGAWLRICAQHEFASSITIILLLSSTNTTILTIYGSITDKMRSQAN